MVVIESKGISDVGKKRKGNEDAMFLDDSMNLYVVADGMGGHLAGEVASNIVVETIRDYMKRFNSINEVPEDIKDSDKSISRSANRLVSSIQTANRGVFELSQKNKSYEGMGSTVSAVMFTDESLIAANVGDSPIYMIHKDEIELISVPHTVFAEQMAIDPDRAGYLDPRYAHMLTRAVGIEETVKPDVCETSYFKNDILVLSSDGLSDKVAPEEILEIVGRELPDRACKTLVDLANERGGDDNITVIVLKVKEKGNKKGWFAWMMSKIGKVT
jgi:protein phosphatase